MNERRQHDEAVSSVMGEMIMIALVIILVALFATSAFSLIPGGREASVDVVMKWTADDAAVFFWHKGGDWVEKKDLTVVVIGDDRSRKEYANILVYDEDGDPAETFDLGGHLEVGLDRALRSGDTVRLVTSKNVIYSGEIEGV